LDESEAIQAALLFAAALTRSPPQFLPLVKKEDFSPLHRAKPEAYDLGSFHSIYVIFDIMSTVNSHFRPLKYFHSLSADRKIALNIPRAGMSYNVAPVGSGLGRDARNARMLAKWGAITPEANTRSMQ
jgi:hypothetical protein